MPRKRKPVDVGSLARNHTNTAVNVLAGVMNCPDAAPAARVAAASAILDRGWGKPAQRHTGPDGEGPIQFGQIEIVLVRPEDRSS